MHQPIRAHVEAAVDLDGARDRLCARRGADRVTRFFCATPPPPVRSLRELLAGLGLTPFSGAVRVAFTGNSTAAGLRSVNPLNPRSLVFDGVPKAPASTRQFLAEGFTRGEQVVELVTRDEVTKQLEFFVVVFDQPCNRAGCSLRDLLTERIESGWTRVVPVHASELTNTAVDCLRCHQVDGKRVLRMQEFAAPWMHFFGEDLTESRALAETFLSAHGAEASFGGVPVQRVARGSDPASLSSLVAQESEGTQPNEFRSFPIQLEAQHGERTEWNRIFEEARAGRAIAVPHWSSFVTERRVLDEVAAQYRAALLDETLPVPDVRHLLSHDAEASMSIRATPGATARELVAQQCRSCHHRGLDPSVSRARFDADDFERLPLEVRQRAVQRLRLAADDVLVMPPSVSSTLSDEERDVLEAALLP